MVDETTTPGEGRDSPLYKLTQKVLTATEGHALIARADYLERKRVDKEAIVAANKAALEQARTDTFAKQQQGQEVMLSRDGQLQTHKGNKSLVTVAESIKKLETHKEEGKTDATSSDVGGLRAVAENTKKTVETTSDNEVGWLKQLRTNAHQAWEKQGNMENLFETMKADGSLLLGRFSALTNLPFFNTVKTLLAVMAKASLRLLWFVGTQLMGFVSWLFKQITKDRKAQKKLRKDRAKFNKKDGDYRTKEGRAIRKREKKLGMKPSKRKDGKAERRMPQWIKKIQKSLKSMLKWVKNLSGPKKFVLLIAGVFLLGYLLKDWIMKKWKDVKDFVINFWPNFKEAMKTWWYGTKAGNEAVATGLIEKNTWNPFERRNVDPNKLEDATTEQLKAIAIENQIHPDSIKAIFQELDSRGEDLGELELPDLGIGTSHKWIRFTESWKEFDKDTLPPLIQNQNEIDEWAPPSSSTYPWEAPVNIQNNHNTYNNNKSSYKTHSYSVDPQTVPGSYT